MPKERTALVLSADPTLHRELEPLLREAGFLAQARPFAAAALHEIRKHPPSLVLAEITSDADGLELVRRLEGGRFWGDVPLIAIGQHPELEYELPDIFDFLSRPLDRARLCADLHMLRQEASRAPHPSPAPAGKTLRAFEEFIHQHSGLHFDERNRKALQRALARRMRAIRVRSHGHYLDYLRAHAKNRGELQKLLSLLTIGETCFFRYLPQFEALRRSVIPALIRQNADRRAIRLWSAGCSTGEEPYSLAILLQRDFPELKDWNVEILGTDINHRSLRRAREGFYGPRALRLLDRRTTERFFTPESRGFRIKEAIRSRVRFAHLNLQTGRYPDERSGTANVDVIFCRNVMIYFRPDTVRSILCAFDRCLAPEGRLFLGHAESLARLTSAFTPVAFEGGFCYRRSSCSAAPVRPDPPARHAPAVSKASARPEAPATPRVSASPAPDPPRQRPGRPGADTGIDAVFQEAQRAFEQEDFKTAADKYDIVLRQDPRHVGAQLGQGFIRANRGEYDKALHHCRQALDVDDLCAEGYFLLGLVHDLCAETGRAVEEYRRAIMLDAGFAMAHYNLAKIYQRLGRRKDAAREIDNTRRILERLPDESLIGFSGGLSREVFLEICREDTDAIRT